MPGIPTHVRFEDPHNQILRLLTSVGALGTLIFLILVVVAYKRMLSLFLRNEDMRVVLIIAAAISSLTAFLVQAQFNPYTILPSTLFWIVIFIGSSQEWISDYYLSSNVSQKETMIESM